MLGKLRKKIKKVVKSDPLVRKTAKVAHKTGGPLGKAVSRELVGKRVTKPRQPGEPAGGKGPGTLGVGSRIGTGGTSPKQGVGMRTGGNAPKAKTSTLSRLKGSPFARASEVAMNRISRRRMSKP